MQKGYLFDIQGFSVHDGPGCRTLIFMKGCNLNCFWCSNPEGNSSKPVPLYFASKCIYDANCLESCPHDAISITNNHLEISRDLCSKCESYACADACLTDALCISGYEISTDELFKIIERDRQFWGNSGGITLTGGEPLLQIDFAGEILQKCYDAYIHTAIETCGNVPWVNFEKVMPFLDWIFFDLKHMNPAFHKKATGAYPGMILENAARLAGEFTGRLIFRLPLIPGFNDTAENIEAVASFINKAGKKEINLLPLHHLGREKYNLLNKPYQALDYPPPTKTDLEKVKKHFTTLGVKCYINDETPF